jgi:hypothetical protein
VNKPSGIAGWSILFPVQLLDLAHQGIPELRPKSFPPGDLHVKRDMIVLLESLERNVVKGIGCLNEISLLTKRKSDPGITSKNRQTAM